MGARARAGGPGQLVQEARGRGGRRTGTHPASSPRGRGFRRGPARRMPARPRSPGGGFGGAGGAAAAAPAWTTRARFAAEEPGIERAGACACGGGSYETQPDCSRRTRSRRRSNSTRRLRSACAYQDGGGRRRGWELVLVPRGRRRPPWTDASARETAAVSNAAASAGTGAYATAERRGGGVFRQPGGVGRPALRRTGTGTRR